MRHYSARQRSDGRWDYTCGDQPIGYCAPARLFDAEYHHWLFGSIAALEQANKRIQANIHKYHTGGHATAVEACTCYRSFLLDEYLQLHAITMEAAQAKRQQISYCQFPGCNQLTACLAEIPSFYRYWSLCETHLNREAVEQIFEVGEAWIS